MESKLRSVQFRIPGSPEKDASHCYRAAHLDFGPGPDPPGPLRAHPFLSEHWVRAFQSGEEEGVRSEQAAEQGWLRQPLEGQVLAFPFGKGVDRWGMFRGARQSYSYLA